MWRVVVFVGLLLIIGGVTGGATGGANGGTAEGANGGAVGGANENLNINCNLYLHNPDRCIFFIGLNLTSSTYYAIEYFESLDLVKKVCEGSHTLNGTSVTSNYVKVQHTDELQQIAEKYPLKNEDHFFILAGISNGSSSGDVNDYVVYRYLEPKSYLHFSSDYHSCSVLHGWVGNGDIALKYIACQVDLTAGSTPKPGAKAEGQRLQAADGKAFGQTAQAADQIPEGNYVFFFELLASQVSVAQSKSSIDCVTDAKFVGSNISVSIDDANCTGDLRALGINSAQGGSIERSFPADAEIVEKCKSPQLAFIGLDRNTLTFAFRCRSWECKPPVWPTVVIAVLAVLLVGVLSGIGLFLYMDSRGDPTVKHDKSSAGETAELGKPTPASPAATTNE